MSSSPTRLTLAHQRSLNGKESLLVFLPRKLEIYLTGLEEACASTFSRRFSRSNGFSEWALDSIIPQIISIGKTISSEMFKEFVEHCTSNILTLVEKLQ